MTNTFGWDLPPGVTTQMIDDAFGGDDIGICDHCKDELSEDDLIYDGDSVLCEECNDNNTSEVR